MVKVNVWFVCVFGKGRIVLYKGKEHGKGGLFMQVEWEALN
jgi:hypothetical protein